MPWTGTEVNLQSSIPEFQPATPMDPMMIEVTVTPQISPVATKARPTEDVGTSADVVPRVGEFYSSFILCFDSSFYYAHCNSFVCRINS